MGKVINQYQNAALIKSTQVINLLEGEILAVNHIVQQIQCRYDRPSHDQQGFIIKT